MTEPRNAAVYARVSSASQGKKRDPWHSLPRQREALIELAARLGYRLVAVYEEVISGAASARPMWDAMRGRVAAGEVNAVLAVDFTRLTRTESLGDWELVKNELRAAGCIIATMQAVYTLEGEEEELTTDIQAAVSKHERKKIRKRSYDARKASAQAGKFVGHPTPFGYALEFDAVTGARRYSVNPEEAAAVRRVFEMYLAGDEGQTHIAQRLNEEGVPGVEGRPWRRTLVRYVLESPKYAGMASFKRELVPSNDFLPIVPMETWERAQAIRERRREGRGPRGPGQPYPLSGILRCAGCGGTLGHKGNHVAGPEHPMERSTYGCQRHRYNNLDACPAPKGYSMVAAHEAVLGFLRWYLPKHLDEVRRQDLRALKARVEPPDVADHRRQLLEKERQREALLLKLADGKISDEDASFTLASLGRQVTTLKAKLVHVDQAQERETKAAGKSAALRPLLKVVKAASLSDRAGLRAVFQEALDAIHLRFVGRHPENYKRFVYEVSHARLADGHEYRAEG